MSQKYRIKTDSKKIVGPFTTQEVFDYYNTVAYTGTEEAQLFPLGNWEPIEKFPELNEKLLKIQLDKDKLSQSYIKASGENSHFSEFKFEKNVNIDIDYKELEKKYNEADPDDFLEKTIIRKKPPQSPEFLDKTVIKKDINISELLNPIPKKKIEVEIKKPAKEKTVFHQIIKSDKEIAEEKTQFFDIGDHIAQINTELNASESEFSKQAKIEEVQEIVKAEREKAVPASEEFERETKEVKSKKGGVSWIVALTVIVLVYYFLFPDEEKKANGPLYLNIKFPMVAENVDEASATKLYKKGLEFYAVGSYEAKNFAYQYFLNSVEKQFDGNLSLGLMLLSSAEIIENSKDEALAKLTFFKVLKAFEKTAYSDVNAVTAFAIFFGKIDKPLTGIGYIKNFLRQKGKPSIKLLSAYLELLVQAGDFLEARKVLEKLEVNSKLPKEAHASKYKYYIKNEQWDLADKESSLGLKLYPQDVGIILLRLHYLSRNQLTKEMQDLLMRAETLNLEKSPFYLSQFFKYKGIYLALNKKIKEASAFFTESLKLKEDSELREQLANLSIGGGKEAESLILQSKFIEIEKVISIEIKNKNWEKVITLINEVLGENPDRVETLMLLIDSQIKRGLYSQAIKNLIELKEKNNNNIRVVKQLIQTNVDAFRFDDAQKYLQEAGQMKFSQDAEYTYLYAQLFENKQNLNLAIKNYNETLRRNPLHEQSLFKLAKIFYRTKKFKDAIKLISELRVLDPRNVDYVNLYARILYEQKNSDVAIGYLRDYLDNNGENAQVLATIAEIYFKSGQLKEFNNYLNKVKLLNQNDESLYEFLASASRLDESWGDFENYTHELLKINPGKLKNRMELVQYYFKNNRFLEAKKELDEIKSKLDKYPNVHFMLAKIYIAEGDLQKADEMARLEMDSVPDSDQSFYILGEVQRVKKEYREASLNLEKAIGKNSKNIDALISLGWIRLNQNLAGEALDLYTRASKLDESIPEIHRQLGYTYKALGQRAIAKEKFEDYIKLNPGANDRSQIEALIKNLK